MNATGSDHATQESAGSQLGADKSQKEQDLLGE